MAVTMGFVMFVGMLRSKIKGIYLGLVCGLWIVLTGHFIATEVHADQIQPVIPAQNQPQFHRDYLARELGHRVDFRIWWHLHYRAQQGVTKRRVYSSRTYIEHCNWLWFTWLYQAVLLLGFAAFGGWKGATILLGEQDNDWLINGVRAEWHFFKVKEKAEEN